MWVEADADDKRATEAYASGIESGLDTDEENDAADWAEQATTWALCALNYSPPEALVPGPFRVSAAADVGACGCTLWDVGSLRAVMSTQTADFRRMSTRSPIASG